MLSSTSWLPRWLWLVISILPILVIIQPLLSFTAGLVPWLWLPITILPILYLVAHALYNIYFHPLVKFPGPKTWALTRLTWVWSLASGSHPLRIKELHDQYGPIVRVAPDELSFIDGAAWPDIYCKGERNKGLPKSEIVFGSQQFYNWFDTNSEEHSRLRRKLAYSFSDQALASQEPLLQKYVIKMIDKLHEASITGKPVDIMKWLNWFSFDVTGELAFSESFEQLDRTASHPWTTLITSHIRFSAFNVCLRFYRPLDRLFPLLVPSNLRRMKWEFLSMAGEKVHRRLTRTSSEQLEDIIATCLPHTNNGKEFMDTEALISSFTFFIIAGSETVATTLAGLVNLLCQNPHVMQQLTAELRATPGPRALTLATTASMPYLNAVIKEGLRFCHPVPGALARVVPPEGKIIAGCFVPGNTLVGISHYAAYNSEKNFRSPTQFNPDRWLGNKALLNQDTLSVFQPFAMGGHSCIGQNLARAELRLVLAHLLYGFDLEVAEEMRWQDQECYFLWQKRSFMVRLRAVTKD